MAEEDTPKPNGAVDPSAAHVHQHWVGQNTVPSRARIRWRIRNRRRARTTVAPLLDDRMPTHDIPVRPPHRQRRHTRRWVPTAKS